MPKRIIDGVTYNTDTATRVATQSSPHWTGEYDVGESHLYLTRGGAFFLVEQTDWDHDEKRWGKNEFIPLRRDAAQAWTLVGDVEILAPVFDDPPEAEDEAPGASGATLYVRVPASLKDQLAAAAEANGLSLNSFMLRCAERCLKA